jgi:hypothetical protein
MKFRFCATLLALGILSPLTRGAGFDELPQVRVLFVDLLDASQCLQITPENCQDLYNKSSQYDVAKWIGTLFCRPPQLDTCEACYSHIDGKNIVGVLPIVHEAIREPSALHATSGSKALQNHYINDWGTLATGTSRTYQESSLSWYTKTLTASQILSWMPATVSLGTVNTSNAASSSKTPVRANLAYTSGTTVLSVPESLLSETFTEPAVNIPFPSVLDLSSGRAYNPLTQSFDSVSYVNSATNSLGANPLNQVAPTTTNGTLTKRTDPFPSDLVSTDKAGFYYPAKRYTYSLQSSRLSAANLTQCGVKYEVFARGSVNPDFLKAYATEYVRAGLPSATGGTTNVNLTGVTGNRGTFNAVTGMWSGAQTYIPYDNFTGVNNTDSNANLAISSLSSKITTQNTSILAVLNSTPDLRQSYINKTISTDLAPATGTP